MSAFVIIFIIVSGIVLLLLMNCRVYSYLADTFKRTDVLWWTVLSLVMIVPLIISLLFNSMDIYWDILLSYFLWYVIPVIILVFCWLNGKRRIITIKDSTGIITVTGITIAILMLGMGFDIRSTSILYDVFGESYNINALQLSTILLLFIFKFEDNLFTECPFKCDRKTFLRAGIKLGILFLLILPIGLLSGFLVWNPVITLSFEPIFIFLGIYITIALPEELLIRAYILNSWDQLYVSENSRKTLIYRGVVLLAVSILFGLSHWNNTSPSYIPWYVILASVAGIIYGLAWREGKLHEAMIIHTLVDWIWLYFFKV
ncbi:MAG: CPBP family glutamic-type intramembrane protease [Candidatus Hodarchaeales archaeon]